jgi:hypothetical protein
VVQLLVRKSRHCGGFFDAAGFAVTVDAEAREKPATQFGQFR